MFELVKKVFFIITVLSLGLIKSQEAVVDRLSVSGPIEYDAVEYYLCWSKQQSKTLTIQQFLPKDETIEEFNQLLNFSYFNKDIDLELAVRQKVESIQNLEKKDKYVKVNVTESPDGKEFIVDYSVSGTTDKEDSFIEYNIYRFKKYDSKENKPLLILSYSKRIYGDLKSAYKNLYRERDHLMTAIIEYKIPEITIINQEIVDSK